MTFLPVEGKANLYRDVNSNAIINKDTNGYRQYMQSLKEKEEQKNKMTSMENDIISLKNDISELKDLIIGLSNKL